MTDLHSLIDTWGYLNVFEAIHPDDREIYKQSRLLGWSWHCQSVTHDGYLSVTRETHIVRVKSDGYWVIPINPIYKIGDEVKIKIEPHSGKKARIENIGWHSNHKREYYHLRIGGRKSSRWYWRDDIEPYTEI